MAQLCCEPPTFAVLPLDDCAAATRVLEEEELARRKTLATGRRPGPRLRINSAAAASPRRVLYHTASAVVMRVEVISRSTDDFTRERSQDLQKVFRNYDPALRTQEKPVEYTRALNAAKLEKIFAKPFIGAMDGHIDVVSCMAKNPNYLKAIFSGSMDGDICLWDIAARKTVCQFPGHQGAVRGLATSTDGDLLISCGVDCMGVDHQWDGNLFATVGAQVDIWDHNRSEPINSFEWGKDTVLSVRFNPGEPDVLITSASDRSITLNTL